MEGWGTRTQCWGRPWQTWETASEATEQRLGPIWAFAKRTGTTETNTKGNFVFSRHTNCLWTLWIQTRIKQSAANFHLTSYNNLLSSEKAQCEAVAHRARSEVGEVFVPALARIKGEHLRALEKARKMGEWKEWDIYGKINRLGGHDRGPILLLIKLNSIPTGLTMRLICSARPLPVWLGLTPPATIGWKSLKGKWNGAKRVGKGTKRGQEMCFWKFLSSTSYVVCYLGWGSFINGAAQLLKVPKQ